jgi:L-2-hydroxycarboxylate dehydrogenase (NAD+)|tara:strand:+ start:146569 stop:147597 length:1029 start_codon:yes stop_codon:yes gene_type:complete
MNNKASPMPLVKTSELFALTHKILSNVGFTDLHIKAIYDHLLYNEYAGRASHGFVRVKWTLDFIESGALYAPHATPTRDIDRPALKHINGQGNIGIVAALAATKAAIEGAKDAGSCCVGASNYGGTTGNMGYYAKQITDAGLVCIMSCTSLILVSPAAHCKPVNGTNPLCIGIPTGSGVLPIIYDSAVTPISWGEAVLAALNGKELPPNIALDAVGNPTQDARATVPKGSLLPIAAHKGFGLGVSLEILAGPLVGAKAGKSVKGSDGLFIQAIDPSCFGNIETFYASVKTYKDEIKNSPVDGQDIKLRLPGEKSLTTYQNNKDKQQIEISAPVYDKLKELAA